ncbi:hypothetical protein [Sphingomonas abietis]|uniref:Flippase-like domain-containing protein n=1 Tax=Sphingomonas abietis TaxID=3012344 RepID=A0ABY7NP78_9SPHN|nr:hypothetical protein [Sphingomonas abietis]WBO23178.1 hypothetical protein PBT88_03295 [Sphingomonas abietis]
MSHERLVRDGEAVSLGAWIGEDGQTPAPQLEALAASAPRWRQWLGPLLSLSIVAAVLYQIGGVDFARIGAMVPANPLFWAMFAAAYMAQPATEWVIFHRLWNLPGSAIWPLMRKQVGNEVLLGYIGEVYFYGWARRNTQLVAAPFGAIKDVTILSAMLGNLTTVVALVIGWPLLAELPAGLHVQALSGSIGVVIVTSLLVMLFRHRLFSLPRRELWFVSAMHLLRIAGGTALSAAMWHLLLPAVPLSSWVMLATLRLLVSRLPLIPNKELVFAGLALFLIGRNAAAADAMALMAGLFVATHMVVGVALGAGELIGAARAKAAA